MKIFQILHGMCHWETPFRSLDETFNKFPTDCLFVEAPDYVTEQWGFNELEIGDARFTPPDLPEGAEETEMVLNDDTGTFVETTVLNQSITEAKEAKQNENNEALAEFLDNHPITWKDGKQYGITKDDQTEINNALAAYRMQTEMGIEDVTLQWHAVGETAVDWEYKDLQELYAAVYKESYKWYKVNQEYKAQINACDTKADVNAIVILYETEEEKEAREAIEAEEAEREAEMNAMFNPPEPEPEEPDGEP